MANSVIELPTASVVEGKDSQGSYRFIQRLGRLPLVDQAIVTGRSSYQKVKGATPLLIQPAIQSMEDVTLTIIGHLITKIQALPLPLAYADGIACSGLDKLEELQERKKQIIKRLRILESDEKSLSTGDRDFYQRTWLPEFALNGIMRMAEYVLSCASDVQAQPQTFPKPQIASRPQTLKSPTRESIGIPTIPEEDENIASECTTPESGASLCGPDTNDDLEAIQTNEEHRMPVGQSVAENHHYFAEIADETETGVSNQRSNGLEPDEPREADIKKLFRMTRRRKNSKTKH